MQSKNEVVKEMMEEHVRNPAKEKANELIDRFIPAITVTYPKLEWKQKLAKQCAIICVEQEKLLLTKIYEKVTLMEFNMDKTAWITLRVFLENLGIENEQTKHKLEKL